MQEANNIHAKIMKITLMEIRMSQIYTIDMSRGALIQQHHQQLPIDLKLKIWTIREKLDIFEEGAKRSDKK